MFACHFATKIYNAGARASNFRMKAVQTFYSEAPKYRTRIKWRNATPRQTLSFCPLMHRSRVCATYSSKYTLS